MRLLPCLLLTGCHRESFDGEAWAVIVGFLLFLYAVWRVDCWLEEKGWRVVPAPHVGMNAPTSIQEQAAYEAEKGIKHGKHE